MNSHDFVMILHNFIMVLWIFIMITKFYYDFTNLYNEFIFYFWMNKNNFVFYQINLNKIWILYWHLLFYLNDLHCTFTYIWKYFLSYYFENYLIFVVFFVKKKKKGQHKSQLKPKVRPKMDQGFCTKFQKDLQEKPRWAQGAIMSFKESNNCL